MFRIFCVTIYIIIRVKILTYMVKKSEPWYNRLHRYLSQSLRVLHQLTLVVLIGVREMVSFLRFPGLFSVFCLISKMLLPGWSRFFLWFSTPPVFSPNLWSPFQAHQLQLVSSSPACFTVCFSSLVRSWHLFFYFFYFPSVVHRNGKTFLIASSFLFANQY